MAVEIENVERLMEWLADGSDARSAHPAAETLVETLATLAFQGDGEWPDHADRADDYRDRLAAWFAHDSGSESQFVKLTGPDADPGVLIPWFLPVVLGWQQSAGRDESGAASQDEAAVVGYANPSFDGTPGTEFYRLDASSGGYLYSAREDGGDWATYEQRRYSEPARDDAYGLDHRYDRTDGVYQWYDEAAGTWSDQTWADLYAAGRHDTDSAQSVGGDDGAAAAWDESWGMFYRSGPGGAYEFADAVTPGDRSSGRGEAWLSQEQVLLRNAQQTRAEPDEQAGAKPDEQALASARARARAAVETAFAENPELRGAVSDGEIEQAIAILTQEAMGFKQEEG